MSSLSVTKTPTAYSIAMFSPDIYSGGERWSLSICQKKAIFLFCCHMFWIFYVLCDLCKTYFYKSIKTKYWANEKTSSNFSEFQVTCVWAWGRTAMFNDHVSLTIWFHQCTWVPGWLYCRQRVPYQIHTVLFWKLGHIKPNCVKT